VHVPLEFDAFGRGLVAGAVALLASAGIALVSGRRDRPGVLGVPFALAALVAIRTDVAPPLVFVSVALLAIGGLFASRFREWRARLVYLPGSVVIAFADIPGLTVGTRIVVGAGTWLMAVALTEFEATHNRDGFTLLLLPVSAFVPALLIEGGTAQGAIFAGTMLPLVLLALPTQKARLGAAGAACIGAAYFWTAALVAANRLPRLAAAATGIGLLAFEPLNRYFTQPNREKRNRPRQLDDNRYVVLLVGVLGQGAVAAYVVLVTARQASDIALLSVAPVIVGGVLVARAFVPSPRRSSRRRQNQAEAAR
jgi:hypothetical protein